MQQDPEERSADTLADRSGARVLSGATETLLITVAARARASAEQAVPGYRDPTAEQLCEKFDVEFDRYAAHAPTVRGVVARDAWFDDHIVDFLQRHPDGLVLQIGAGLNTVYERVRLRAPEGDWRWIDSDFEPVVDLRRQVLPDDERRTTLVLDAANPDQLDEVLAAVSGPLLVVAEGVLMYMTPEQVESLFRRLAVLETAEAVFDWSSPRVTRLGRRHPPLVRTRDQSVVFRSSMRRASDLARYHPRWKVVTESGAAMGPLPFRMALFALLYRIATFGGRLYGCTHARLA